ncbi:hypothetical protein JCM11491_003927 [Sporobolomyces phaffii]
MARVGTSNCSAGETGGKSGDNNKPFLRRTVIRASAGPGVRALSSRPAVVASDLRVPRVRGGRLSTPDAAALLSPLTTTGKALADAAMSPISDVFLTNLANTFGSLAVVLIVLYQFLEVNAKRQAQDLREQRAAI